MARRRPFSPLTVVLLLVCALLLSWTAPALGPALRLAAGDGRPGVFTARRLDCVRHPGHESCAWTGEFRSRDGVVLRTGVALAGSGRTTHHAGQRTDAVDVGMANRVYGPDGSNEWIFTVFLFLAVLGLLAFAVAPVLGAIRRRLAARATPTRVSAGEDRPGVHLTET
ncbi:hypothetical protein JOL79_04190 [Microbispora sp. RL4-1S]|uniref:Uncharacterized protein n=1 Tax=Microbispora oryzae TaxID=2806554 RepID=A0A941AHR0_9ACTN|nr:hypothetical protein [Microbispora oryzae]MBP2703002.1 hypothetical protein [Microbispora oryzae]